MLKGTVSRRPSSGREVHGDWCFQPSVARKTFHQLKKFLEFESLRPDYGLTSRAMYMSFENAIEPGNSEVPGV